MAVIYIHDDGEGATLLEDAAEFVLTNECGFIGTDCYWIVPGTMTDGANGYAG